MSVRVMSAVFDRYPAGGGEMLLALALADVSRDDGVLMLNDSVAELARKTRQTARGVQLQLARMRAAGWLHLVHASDGGRCRVSVYRIDAGWINGAALRPASGEAGADEVAETPQRRAAETLNRTTRNPERRSGFAKPETLNAATRNPERGSGAIEPLIPNTGIHPPAPQGGRALSAEAGGSETGRSASAESGPWADPTKGPMTMRTWLVRCRDRGVKPIPADDAVWGYAADVGVDAEFVALAWWLFKRKRLDSAKRQRGFAGWAQTFRNAVEGNWYRLWWMQPGKPATLTTQGLQALAARDAEREVARGAALDAEAGAAGADLQDEDAQADGLAAWPQGRVRRLLQRAVVAA